MALIPWSRSPTNIIVSAVDLSHLGWIAGGGSDCLSRPRWRRIRSTKSLTCIRTRLLPLSAAAAAAAAAAPAAAGDGDGYASSWTDYDHTYSYSMRTAG